MATNCNSTHSMKSLSFFSAGLSAALMLSTLILNILLILALIRNKRRLKSYMFYKLLFNISVADLLTSLLSDVVSVTFHVKEGLRQYIPKVEITLLHIGLFFINGVSVLTLALICIDRVTALVKPNWYRTGLKKKSGITLICLTWIASGALCVPYMFLGYIRYLMIFSCGTVALALISLVITVCLYMKVQKMRSTSLRKKSSSQMRSMDKDVLEKYVLDAKRKRILGVHSKRLSSIKSPSELKTSEERITKSFLIMLVVFIVTYLPATGMTLYMNSCTQCNCLAVHILRDLTYIAILSSALWRPLNFICRLHTIRYQVMKMCFCVRNGNEIERGSSLSSRTWTN